MAAYSVDLRKRVIRACDGGLPVAVKRQEKLTPSRH
jgi:hypothetical protein